MDSGLRSASRPAASSSGGTPVCMAQVALHLGSVRGIALQELVDPAPTQGRDLGDLALAVALGEQPDDLEMALLDSAFAVRKRVSNSLTLRWPATMMDLPDHGWPG